MRKPNIIFILSDDLSYADVGCYGQKHIQTPNIDKIAETGIKFTDAYAAAPICGPSRCGLLTGRHMGHARIREHGQPLSGGGSYQATLEECDRTIGDVMKSAGYATAAIGKWAVGLEDGHAIPNDKGFDYSFGFYDQCYAHTFYPEYLCENGKKYPLPGNYGFDMTKRYRSNFTRWDAENPDANVYDKNGELIIDELPDSHAAQNSYDECEKKALSFIENHAHEPFFLYYAIQNPHGPLIVPSIAPYIDADFPSQRHKEWAAIITRLDTGVGRMMSLLERKGIYDDTILIFASDNGYSAWGYFGLTMADEVPFFEHKGPFRGSKFTLDGEAGIRVPLMFSWRGHIKAGTVTNEPVAFWDLMPTFAELAGVLPVNDADGNTVIPTSPELPDIVTDGVSFAPTLLGQGEKQKRHEYFYWENNHMQAARIGGFKAFRPHPSKPVQLYDLVTDTFESHDIAAEHPDIVEKAEQIFIEAHSPTEIFINPGEDDGEHRKRLDALEKSGAIRKNSFAADSPERAAWLEKFE